MQTAFTIAGTILVVLLVAGIIGFLLTFNRRHWKYEKEKQLLQSQFEQSLLQTQIEIQEHTLKTISEEIHDNVGQVLSLAKLNLNTFETNPTKKLKDTKELLSKAINDLRNLSRSLYGESISEIGLEEAVANELAILNNAGGFDTELKIEGHAYRLSPQKEMVLFRIVQEATHNAMKHAHASKLTLILNYGADFFFLSIIDNGNGFDLEKIREQQNGIGLKSMRSRAKLIGGILTINSNERSGTCISIKLEG